MAPVRIGGNPAVAPTSGANPGALPSAPTSTSTSSVDSFADPAPRPADGPGGTPSSQPASFIHDPRAALAAFQSSAGYALMAAPVQALLSNLLAQPDLGVAMGARSHLQLVLKDPALQDPAAQAQALSALANSKGVLPYLVGNDLPPPKVSTDGFSVGEPVVKPGYGFAGQAADAAVFPVSVQGQVVQVIAPMVGGAAPSTADHGLPGMAPRTNHSVQEAAQMLASLPPENRRLVKSVVLEPAKNPADVYWGKQYATADFNSYMTAGPDGVIRIYPQSRAMGVLEMIKSAEHETGHIWSFRAGERTSSFWKEWLEAEKKDGIAPSQYAQASKEEDAAESTEIFTSTRGTALNAQYQSLMPNRAALINKYLPPTSN